MTALKFLASNVSVRYYNYFRSVGRIGFISNIGGLLAIKTKFEQTLYLSIFFWFFLLKPRGGHPKI